MKRRCPGDGEARSWISATQLESYRLYMQPNQEWMSEDDILATIRGEFVPNHKVNLGTAYGRVLESPERYAVAGGYRVNVNGEAFEFGADVVAPALALIDHAAGVFEAKAVKSYGRHEVASRADYLLGGELHEFKTTLSTFDFDKYAQSVQWRYMVDAFQPVRVTYHVFCLSEGANGVIELRSIETFSLYPYPELHADCARLVTAFAEFVTVKGLAHVLDARQASAA
jgi:hypothetical protein